MRIQASTQEPKDMRMQGCKHGHMNLKIKRCKGMRIQASTYKQGYENARIKTSQIYKTCRLLLDFTPVYIPNDYVYISRYVYISNGIYQIIFWCTIHHTLPIIRLT